jgi:hypothetical protein
MTARILAAAILLCAAGKVSSQDTAKAALHGVVKSVGTDEPIAGAQVMLSNGTLQSPVAVAYTDEAGEFSLTEIDRVSYRFSVGKNGYVRYDSREIALANESPEGVVVHLKKTATVTGRVSGATGKPLAGITIKLIRRNYDADGFPGFSTAGTFETNELGEYRAYWITPGRYYLSATSGLTSGFSPPINLDPGPSRPFDGRNGMRDNYPETFFPGVMDISQARAVDLEEGADVRTVDFTLVRQEQAYRVRGRVVDGATGQAAGDAMVFLGGGSDPRWHDRATGTFELPNMKPGRYGIMARLAGSNDASVAPWVFATISVVDSSIDNLVLRVPAPIQGQIRIEGQPPTNAPLESIRVRLIPVPTSPPGPPLPLTPSAAVAADGKFRISVPMDGEYRVKVSGLPASFYLKEAQLDDVDVLRAGSRFFAAGRLNLLLSTRAGEVIGRAINDSMEPARVAEAVLIPTEGRQRSELFKRTAVTNGQFRFQGVAPGDYKVFVWQNIEGNAFFDAEVLKRFDERGVPVHVAELSRETVEVRVIPETVSP